MSTNTTRTITPEEIADGLAQRRAVLAGDAHEMATRLAPRQLRMTADAKVQELRSLARAKADAKVDELRGRVRARVADLKARACPRCRAATTPEEAGCQVSCADRFQAMIADLSPASLHRRATRLLDDARDGDPASLGLVTGGTVALAGVSVAALVKAVRR